MAKTIIKRPYESLGVDLFLKNNSQLTKTVDVYYGVGKGENFYKWGSLDYKTLPALQTTKLSGSLLLDLPGGTYDLIVKVMDPEIRRYIATKTFSDVVTVAELTTPIEVVDYSLNGQKSVTVDPYGTINVNIKLHNRGAVDRTVDVYYGIGKDGNFVGSAWSVLTYKRLPVCQTVSLDGNLYPSGISEGTYDFIVRVMDLERKFVLGEKTFPNVVTVKKVTTPPPPPQPSISIVDYEVNGQKYVSVTPFDKVTVTIYVDSNVRDTFWADIYIVYDATRGVELYKELWVNLVTGRNKISATFDYLRGLDLGYHGVGAKIGKGSTTYAERYWGNVINISF
jgi:hypothetical protein